MAGHFRQVGRETTLHRGRLIELVQQEMTDGLVTQTFEFARRGPGTRIIFLDGTKILITREYRYERGGFDLRLPGGKVFDSLSEYTRALSSKDNISEFAAHAAVRECIEEVRLKPTNLKLLHQSQCGATIVWDLFFFLCTSWEAADHGRKEAGEIITLDWYPVQAVLDMCLRGEISEDRSAMAIVRTFRGNVP